VRQAGFRLDYCPKSIVYHRADGSHDNGDPKYMYSTIRNKIIFSQKYLPRLLRPLWWVAYEVYVQRLAHLRLRIGAEGIRNLRAAQRAAFRDHRRAGRSYVEEQDLLNFEREYRAMQPENRGLAES
jgi:GT2 family glycosyltransferase